jgi:hypothetical protein
VGVVCAFVAGCGTPRTVADPSRAGDLVVTGSGGPAITGIECSSLYGNVVLSPGTLGEEVDILHVIFDTPFHRGELTASSQFAGRGSDVRIDDSSWLCSATTRWTGSGKDFGQKGETGSKDFTLNVDGRKKTVEMNGREYSFQQGEIFVVRFDEHWNATVFRANDYLDYSSAAPNIRGWVRGLSAGELPRFPPHVGR